MGKSFDEEITELQDKIKEVEQKKYQAEHPHTEYPKWVTDTHDPSKGYVVSNAKEEALVGKGQAAGQVGNTFDLTPEEQEAKRLAKAEADKEAARGQSRLGPDASTRAGREAERKGAKKADPAPKPKPSKRVRR